MKKNWSLILLGLMFCLSFGLVKAQELLVDYGNQVITDKDLDGLTDKGEEQLFKTDLENPDSDQDGILDGAEILNKTDPLNAASPGFSQTIIQTAESKESPWAWYFSRASALISFGLLYISIFLGLAIRTPVIKKILAPAYSLEIHGWISVQALVFALIHGTSLLLDDYLAFGLRDIFLPFFAKFEPTLVGMGGASLYLMIILIITSYFNKYIPRKIWRLLHSLNILIFIFGSIHALSLGTDLKNGLSREVFIALNLFLATLFLVNIIYRAVVFLKGKKNNAESNHEDLPPHLLP